MEAVFYFSFAAMVAIPLTATICRWRVARGKRISVGTIFTGASSAALLSIVWIPFFDAGTTAFTHEYWAHLKIGSGIPFLLIFIFWCLTCLACILSAWELFIIKREKRNNVSKKTKKRHPFRDAFAISFEEFFTSRFRPESSAAKLFLTLG
jgi:hypothetical protein